MFNKILKQMKNVSDRSLLMIIFVLVTLMFLMSVFTKKDGNSFSVAMPKLSKKPAAQQNVEGKTQN